MSLERRKTKDQNTKNECDNMQTAHSASCTLYPFGVLHWFSLFMLFKLLRKRSANWNRRKLPLRGAVHTALSAGGERREKQKLENPCGGFSI